MPRFFRKPKKIPSKITKLLYDSYLRGHEAGKQGLIPKTFEEFRDQLQRDYSNKISKRKA